MTNQKVKGKSIPVLIFGWSTLIPPEAERTAIIIYVKWISITRNRGLPDKFNREEMTELLMLEKSICSA